MRPHQSASRAVDGERVAAVALPRTRARAAALEAEWRGSSHWLELVVEEADPVLCARDRDEARALDDEGDVAAHGRGVPRVQVRVVAVVALEVDDVELGHPRAGAHPDDEGAEADGDLRDARAFVESLFFAPCDRRGGGTGAMGCDGVRWGGME